MCYKKWLHITKFVTNALKVLYSFYIALKRLKLKSLYYELNGTHENKCIIQFLCMMYSFSGNTNPTTLKGVVNYNL